MPVRVDKWLWAVRAYKTRTQATDACTAGRVRVNGDVAKPATKVGPGDVVQAVRRERTLIYAVIETLEKRVSATRAATAFEDRSPPVPTRVDHVDQPVFAQRDRGSGRPTKKDRRAVDRLMGRRP